MEQLTNFSDSHAAFGPDRALALHYAPASQRAAVELIWHLDARLRDIALTTREPMLGRIKLQWWADQLGQLDHGRPPAEPLLASLVECAVDSRMDHKALADIAFGWQQLVQEDTPSIDDVMAHGSLRGTAMFRLMAGLAGSPRNARDVSATAVLIAHGPAWAIWDFARLLPKGPLRDQTRDVARQVLPDQGPGRVPRNHRAIGALVVVMRGDLASRSVADRGPLARVTRLVWHRMTGL